MARRKRRKTRKSADDKSDVVKRVPVGTLWRLPKYLAVSQALERAGGWDYVTSADLARACEVKEVLVRKDLSCIRASGRPRLGYLITELCRNIEAAVGWNRARKLAVVGPTVLAEALRLLLPLEKLNLEVTCVVDDDHAGETAVGVRVLSMEEFLVLQAAEPVGVALVATSAEQAQALVDRLVEAGVKAVWNFSPTTLAVPDDVCAENADIASGLAVLCHRLSKSGR